MNKWDDPNEKLVRRFTYLVLLGIILLTIFSPVEIATSYHSGTLEDESAGTLAGAKVGVLVGVCYLVWSLMPRSRYTHGSPPWWWWHLHLHFGIHIYLGIWFWVLARVCNHIYFRSTVSPPFLTHVCNTFTPRPQLGVMTFLTYVLFFGSDGSWEFSVQFSISFLGSAPVSNGIFQTIK